MEKFEFEEDYIQHEQNTGQRSSQSSSRMLRTLAGAIFSIIVLKLLWSVTLQPHLSTNTPNFFYLQRGGFGSFPVGGFVNTGSPGKINCDDIRHDGDIQVQRSFHLKDDLRRIATELNDHPMIKYEGPEKNANFEKQVESRWAKTSESSAWLEEYKAYVAISRVIFFNESSKRTPVMSFLRGQLYTSEWVEMVNRTITWQGHETTFPTVFDIPTPFEEDGAFYGPEHPQVIIEEGVEGAEPVVLFNMLTELHNPVQTMHIYRPFTNHLTALSVNGHNIRGVTERYWSPFFYQPNTPRIGHQKWPSKDIHFIYDFKPLRVLRCQLSNGYCEWVYEQDIPEDFESTHNFTWGALNGGTNFVPIPLKGATGTTAYVGFPRTHIPGSCIEGVMSKSEMMVMTVSSGSHFHIDFLSDYIDFRTAVLPEAMVNDVCGAGRNLVANSISRWDHTSRQDVMTLSLVVGTETQTLRVDGILSFLQRLPYLKQSLKHDIASDGEFLWDYRWSTMGNEVVACSLEMAQARSVELTAPQAIPPEQQVPPFRK